jgi:hypothetical protein
LGQPRTSSTELLHERGLHSHLGVEVEAVEAGLAPRGQEQLPVEVIARRVLRGAAARRRLAMRARGLVVGHRERVGVGPDEVRSARDDAGEDLFDLARARRGRGEEGVVSSEGAVEEEGVRVHVQAQVGADALDHEEGPAARRQQGLLVREAKVAARDPGWSSPGRRSDAALAVLSPAGGSLGGEGLATRPRAGRGGHRGRGAPAAGGRAHRPARVTAPDGHRARLADLPARRGRARSRPLPAPWRARRRTVSHPAGELGQAVAGVAAWLRRARVRGALIGGEAPELVAALEELLRRVPAG